MADLCVVTRIPGPQGVQGTAGTNGTNGVNAFTTLSANFTMPAANATVTIEVGSTAWMVPKTSGVGQPIVIASAGAFEVQSITDSTHAIVKNLGYSTNVVAGTVIALGQGVAARGFNGSDGSNGVSALNAISPTTTKGDLIVDNGLNSPSASVTRQAVGTDGQAMVADSAQANGVKYSTITPNATATPADTDNYVARYNAPAGNETPAPLQTSKLLITDNGAIQSTGTGGNARGNNAVDLQVSRVAGTQVASGGSSVISGGGQNTSSGTNSTVGGGLGNISSSSYSTVGGGTVNTAGSTATTVGGGQGNTASNTWATVGGGTSNTASGVYAFVGGGSGSTASGFASCIAGGTTNISSNDYSTVGGGAGNLASGNSSTVPGGLNGVAQLYGQCAYSTGGFGVGGDAQYSAILYRIGTTNGTQTEMFLDGASARATIPTSTSWTFKGIIVGRRDNGDSATWEFKGGIKNVGGVISLIGSVTIALISADAGCSATWGVAGSIAIDADAANASLRFRVTGTAANNIRWVAKSDLVEARF